VEHNKYGVEASKSRSDLVLSAGNGAFAWKGTTSRVVVACRPKLIFDQMAALVPEIIDTTLYSFIILNLDTR
jgi:hypothetical protein